MHRHREIALRRGQDPVGGDVQLGRCRVGQNDQPVAARPNAAYGGFGNALLTALRQKRDGFGRHVALVERDLRDVAVEKALGVDGMAPNGPIAIKGNRLVGGLFPGDLLSIDIEEISRAVEDPHHVRPCPQGGRIRRRGHGLAPIAPPAELKVAAIEPQVKFTLGGGNEAAGDDVAQSIFLFRADPCRDGTGRLVAEIQRSGLPKHHAGFVAAEAEGSLVGM